MSSRISLELRNLKYAEWVKVMMLDNYQFCDLKIDIKPPYIDVSSAIHMVTLDVCMKMYEMGAADELVAPSEEEVLI